MEGMRKMAELRVIGGLLPLTKDGGKPYLLRFCEVFPEYFLTHLCTKDKFALQVICEYFPFQAEQNFLNTVFVIC